MRNESAITRPRLFRGLSGRVFLLVIGVSLLVQFAVVAILVTNRWTDHLSERLAASLVAVLVQDAAGDMEVRPQLQQDLLMVAGVESIALKTEDYRQLVLVGDMPGPVSARIDLRTEGFFDRFYHTCHSFLRGGEGVLQVIGPLQKMPGEFIEILLPEEVLYATLKEVLLGGLAIAFAIALLVGATLFFVLSKLLVDPVRRLTQSMVNFSKDPEDPANTLTAWNRYDEVGTAARGLRDLQIRLRNLLGEKRRLADLGGAVARINHDLRNLFATMQLVSDSLARVDDERVKRAAPRLVRALERGIALCQATLDYGRAGTQEASVKRQPLRPIIAEALDQFTNATPSLETTLDVFESLEAQVDSDHLFRIISNLTRNSLAVHTADTCQLVIRAKAKAGQVHLSLSDDGPGIAPAMTEQLFSAFGQSASKGGSGLGLAISRELARSMEGDLTLEETGPSGTSFAILLKQ